MAAYGREILQSILEVGTKGWCLTMSVTIADIVVAFLKPISYRHRPPPRFGEHPDPAAGQHCEESGERDASC